MRYIVTFLIGIALVILVIILMIRALFGGAKQPTTPEITLADYANTNVVMRLDVWSQVQANQTHQQLRIDVSKYSADIYMYNGYDRVLIKTQTFASNPQAYTDFLSALQLAGYTKGNPDKKLADWRGYCPSGTRYIYQIIDGAKTVQSYWATSCLNSQPKTFSGSSALVNSLYRAQIPSYTEFTSSTIFSTAL